MTKEITSPIAALTLKAIAEEYNSIMKIISGNPIKKFRDKTTACKKLGDARERLDAFNEFYEDKPKKSPAKKYDDGARVMIVKGNKTAKDKTSAMGIIQDYVTNQAPTISKTIAHFQSNWSCPRSSKKNTYSFARGYVIGAIREDYISLKTK